MRKVGGRQLQPDFVSCCPSSQLEVLGVVENSSSFHNDMDVHGASIYSPHIIGETIKIIKHPYNFKCEGEYKQNKV